LYNLRRDPGELENVADVDTDVAAALTEKLHAWRQEVGAQEPTPNEAYDPEKSLEGDGKGKKK
jgi:hypothetical protein